MALLGVDTSSITRSLPLEMLLISSGSSDPHSTVIIDPRTGVSSWSYKGSELQGASTGFVEPLGRNGEHLIITTKERPLVHVLAVHNRDRFHQKTVLSGPVSAICSDKNGKLVFMAIKKQIFSYLLTTGDLLSVTDAHYQNITKLVISDDDSMLFSSSKDGAIHGYLVTELISADRDHTVAPFRKYSSHTLAVSDLKITNGTNPRILSTGLDHIACIHSISIDSVILKVSSDRPLTACAIDSAETRVFVGTDVGNIAQIDCFQLGPERDLLVQTSDENNSQFRILNGHSDEITRLSINTDGSLLASGDSLGKYCIWEISSHQCLKVSTMRSSILTLRFIPYWPSISSLDSSDSSKSRPVWELKREPTKMDTFALELSTDFNVEKDYWKNVIDQTIDQMMLESGSNGTVNVTDHVPMEVAMKEEEDDDDVILIDEDNEDDAPEIGKMSKKARKRREKKLKELREAQKNKKQPKPNLSIYLDSEEPEDVLLDEKPSISTAVDSAESDAKIQALLKEVAELKKDNGRLKEINREMYEFVAKEIISDKSSE